MKKIILYALIVTTLLTALSGCGRNKENPASDFEYTISESGEVQITKYVGRDSTVVIPAQIEEKTVVSIGEKAFYESTITSLVMPDTITEVGYLAFCGCKSLEKVTFSKNLVTIKEVAFSDCLALQEADLSADSLKVLATGAFFNCEALKEVTFGKNITDIQALAFYNCKSLKKIILPENLSELGDNAFLECVGAEEVFIPKTVEKWGLCPFEEMPSLTKVTFEDGLKTIGGGKGVFKNCKVKSLTIPASVESIGHEAFQNISTLESISFEGNAPAIDHSFPDLAQKAICYYDPNTSGWDTTALRDYFELKTK